MLEHLETLREIRNLIGATAYTDFVRQTYLFLISIEAAEVDSLRHQPLPRGTQHRVLQRLRDSLNCFDNHQVDTKHSYYPEFRDGLIKLCVENGVLSYAVLMMATARIKTWNAVVQTARKGLTP